jgi:hypothetical protein
MKAVSTMSLSLPKLCTLLSVFLLCKLPSIHVGAAEQPPVLQSRVLKGGILKSVGEAWDDTARVSEASVETRCRKPSRRLQNGSKSGKGGKGSKGEYSANSVGSSKGKSSKKGGLSQNSNGNSKRSKGSKGSIPYCDDLSQNGASSAPAPSPTSKSPDTPTNGGPAVSPTPTDDSLNNNGVPAPSPTPGDNSILRDCGAIAAGTARTDGGSSQSFAVSANLIIDGTVPIQTILNEIQRVLQLEVAPALAGCISNVRRRRLQQATNIFNVLFGAPEAMIDGKEVVSVRFYDMYYLGNFLTIVSSSSSVDQCTSALADTVANANVSCLSSLMGTDVYYTGNDPAGFLDALRAAISARGNFNINGLLGILGPQVTAVPTTGDGTTNGDGTTINPDGSITTTNPDGTTTTTNPDGTTTTTNPDGSITTTNPDGTTTTTNPDGTTTTTNPDGTTTTTDPDGTITTTDPDGTTTTTDPDGTTTTTDPDGTTTTTDPDGTITTTNPDGSITTTNPDGTTTTTNGDGTANGDGNGSGVAGAQGNADPSLSRGNDGISVGTTVGVTAAGLAIMLFVLLLAGRRRRHSEGEKDEEGPFVHRILTADEDDGEESYTRDMGGAVAHVVTEDDDSVVIRWGEEKNGDESMYSQRIESTLAADDMKFAMENHSCSSPSCKICAMKEAEGVGVRFIPTPRSSNLPEPLSRDSRSYLSNDTVDL